MDFSGHAHERLSSDGLAPAQGAGEGLCGVRFVFEKFF
jgi:hypothetical protein